MFNAVDEENDNACDDQTRESGRNQQEYKT